jgi:hypothetical protein
MESRNLTSTLDRDEPASSVSTVSGYGLDDRAIEVRSPVEAKDFSKRPPHFLITKSDWLMLFKDINAVHKNTKYSLTDC